MHWVVVADATSGKIYESDVMLEELTLVHDVGHGALPSAGQSAKGAHHDPHIVSEERFARAVARVVNEGETAHRFERLVLVAPPHFLGDLRGELSTAAGRKVIASVHHDWTRLHVRELATKVRGELPPV